MTSSYIGLAVENDLLPIAVASSAICHCTQQLLGFPAFISAETEGLLSGSGLMAVTATENGFMVAAVRHEGNILRLKCQGRPLIKPIYNISLEANNSSVLYCTPFFFSYYYTTASAVLLSDKTHVKGYK